MGKGKPRAAKPSDFRPCRRCQVAIPVAQYEHSNALCGPCWKQEWQEHQTYLAQNAIIVAELGVGFTADLFSSELVIEADGGYFQRVRWHNPKNGQTMKGEHLGNFADEEWLDICQDAQSLHRDYSHIEAVMDDVETFELRVRIDNQLQWMQRQAQWQCPDGDRRFRGLWNRIHQHSPWLARLALGPGSLL